MFENYTMVLGQDGWIAIGVCHPPFEPRLVFENITELKEYLEKLQRDVIKYEELRDQQIPKAFKDWR